MIHANATVSYLSRYHITLFEELYSDIASLWGEFYGVAYYVHPHLRKHFRIGGVLYLLHINVKAYVLSRPLLFQKKYTASYLLVKGKTRLVSDDLLIFKL